MLLDELRRDERVEERAQVLAVGGGGAVFCGGAFDAIGVRRSLADCFRSLRLRLKRLFTKFGFSGCKTPYSIRYKLLHRSVTKQPTKHLLKLEASLELEGSLVRDEGSDSRSSFLDLSTKPALVTELRDTFDGILDEVGPYRDLARCILVIFQKCAAHFQRTPLSLAPLKTCQFTIWLHFNSRARGLPPRGQLGADDGEECLK